MSKSVDSSALALLLMAVATTVSAHAIRNKRLKTVCIASSTIELHYNE